MVISSIEVEDRVIKLNQAGLGVPNIFDIDSISLIIGNNGAGKTQYLNKIIEKFTPKAKDDRYSCEIYLDSEKTLQFRDMREEWGVIYYSPIPYGRRLHASKNLIDASPNWAKPLSVFDLRDHHDLLRDFNISPRLCVRKIVDVRKVCRVIVETLIVQPYPKIDNEILIELSGPLLSYLEGTPKRTKKWGDGESESSLDQEKNEKILIDQASHRFYRKLKDSLSNDVEAFCLFAVLEYQIERNKNSREVLRAVTNYILNNTNILTDRKPPEAALQVLVEIDRAKKFLVQRRVDLSMGSRATMEVELDPSEKSPLSSANLEHLFEVGFQNMSSGQWAILAQLSLISDAVKTFSERKIKKVLLLIDEGDAFLHLEWQRKYIGHLNRMLAALKREHGMTSLQVILATHSPLLATDVPKEFICRMEAKGSDGAPSAFAAPLHELLNQSFGAKTVGEFASRKINEAVSNISEGKKSDVDDFIVSSIDNPIIKAEVLRRTRAEGYRG
ncbi:AAA family ATPase [Pseudomonas jessenii]|uniref:Putative AbiEii toxin of type IV toxin-antitoxin system n=1 Tax=Pseudomonas jessenii TaxID=77298 RepID=A0A370S966_PSEJE|nr:AAA family ATPase [Pseudomonas jessenii]RDL16211.1 putative AbiEii toxin of type IV toxin-antitoxin system [Pseudomonas jessenii]